MAESLALRQQLLERKLACREAFLRYKDEHETARLALAAGITHIEGWFCTDIKPTPENGIYYCDMTEKFPFEDESFDYIQCEHGIEHVSFEDGLICLSECYRVLKKGGVVRIATPSLDKWVAYYTREDDMHDRCTILATHLWLDTAKNLDFYSKCLVLNNAMRNWGHQVVYDYETMSRLLLALKFGQVCETEIGASAHPDLRGLERHEVSNGSLLREYNAMEVMVVEAVK